VRWKRRTGFFSAITPLPGSAFRVAKASPNRQHLGRVNRGRNFVGNRAGTAPTLTLEMPGVAWDRGRMVKANHSG